jgi:hypothetical protein
MAARDEVDVLTSVLGRPPEADFQVCVRAADGAPVVIRNAPLLGDGTPMPTLYWLVDRGLRAAVARLESAGGVREAEAAVDAEREAALPPGWSGPRPSGGVGGTRRGVKCLHAHYAYWLAGGDDPVGAWVAERLGEPLG